MRVLITGGAGFIGLHAAKRLAGAHDLVALDNLSPQVHRDPAESLSRFPGEVLVGDVADPNVWQSLQPFGAVIHLAAETGTAQSMYEQERYRRVNVDGARHAAEAAARWGASLTFLSSRAVYGEGRYRLPSGAIEFGPKPGADAVPEASREDDQKVPTSVYGETKAEAESVIARVCRDSLVTIIRPQNVVGHGQALHNPYTGVLAAFLARLRAGNPLQIYGDGHETRDFVHVSDVVSMIEWAVARPDGRSATVNCGTGQRTSLLELASYAIAGSPTGGSYELVDVKRAGDIEHACADMSLAEHLGAPLARVSSADAVGDFIARSWEEQSADPAIWDDALTELVSRGLAT